jgi:hypothetical protein
MPNEAPLWLISIFAVLAWTTLAVCVYVNSHTPDEE